MTSTTDDWADALTPVLERVRKQLASTVEAKCGSSPKAAAIADRFGVYRSLGWQIWNVINLPDPLAAVKHLPPAKPMKVWYEALEKQGIKSESLGAAVDQLNQLLADQGGDRETLEMLLDSHLAEDGLEADLKWRKQMFSGSAYVWGVQAKTLLTSAIICPSMNPRHIDLIRINAHLGLRRTRSAVRWPLSRVALSMQVESHKPMSNWPLYSGETYARTGVPLVEPFCSRPIPQLERRELANGVLLDDLLPGPVGQAGAMDVVLGEVIRDAADIAEDEPGQLIRFGFSVRTPCELTLGDQLVHRSLFKNVERTLHVYSEMAGPFTGDERDAIAIRDNFEFLGSAADRLETAEMPRYGELIDFALSQTPYKRADFDVYRIRMPYPPTPARVSLRHRKVAAS